MKNNKINFIKRRSEQHFVTKGVQVLVKDPLPPDLSAKRIVKLALNKIPKFLLSNLDIIYIGEFDELKNRDLQAIYKDASIFATNDHDSEASMVDDLVHEVAHSIEETHSHIIYSDLEIEKEFILKRKKLWMILSDMGFQMDLSFYLDTSYNVEFDEFLYQEVGYPTLTAHTINLFHSPYAATSLREYFANGFEAFFMREELARLKRVSPNLYKKLIVLLNLENNEQEY